MGFKPLKNIESLFRQICLFGIVPPSPRAVITVWSAWSSYRFAGWQREKIHVLGNSKSLMLVLSQDLSQNRSTGAKEHVCRFHKLFFTFSPEESAVGHNVKRALLLADKSAYNYYSDLAEKEHYNRIIAGNINQVLKADSVVCDFNGYPHRAVIYATQKIIRQNNVTERSLVTTCRLLNSSRSDDSPNGSIIEGFTITGNKDSQTIKGQTDIKKIRKSFWGAYWELHDKKKMLVARLRGYLDGLLPKTYRRIVLATLAAFATLTLYTFGKTVYNIGRNDGSRMVTDHVGQMELSVQQKTENHLILYSYGTDRERNED